MKYLKIFIGVLLITIVASCSKKIIAERPVVLVKESITDTLPLSEIDIPIKINLKPLYEMAERNVDVVYTSNGWPNEWEQDGCDSRYMYHFSRDKLRIAASGNTVKINFTGYYKLKGAQRVCSGSTVLSPWAPACSCGFTEGLRKVEVGFKTSISILPDYQPKIIIERNEPLAIDKCEVCLFKKDITKTVMTQLKARLDAAKKQMEDTVKKTDLKKYFQQLWDELCTQQNMNGFGYLQLNPEKLRISQLNAKGDTLTLSAGISARPLISFEKAETIRKSIPNISDFNLRNGFNVYLDAQLNYDSLSLALTNNLKETVFEIEKPVKKTVVIKSIQLYPGKNNQLILQLDFSGTERGKLFLTGNLEYNPQTKYLEIKNIDYDLKTKDLLIKTATWLFDKRITNELNKYAHFNIGSYLENLLPAINNGLNMEIRKGVFTKGKINSIHLLQVYPLNQHLILRCNMTGELMIRVDKLN